MDKKEVQEKVKIIQFNVWQGKIGKPIINFLKQENPDIVCMQEVNDLKGDSCGMFSTLDEIRTGAGFDYADMAATYSYKFMKRDIMYGNAILSKHPIKQEQVIFINGSYKENVDTDGSYKGGSFRGGDDYNTRNLQICTITLPDGRNLIVANHHGYHTFEPRGDETSVSSVKKVADALKSLSGSFIFCTDLNLVPDSPALRMLDELPLRNLTVENGITRTLGRLHYVDHDIACDYIFTSKDIDVRGLTVSDALVSDHTPLILDFAL